MAFAIRVLRRVGKRFELFPVSQQHSFFCKHANLNSNNPLLLKLVQVPNSRIKTTLDQEIPSLQSSQLSWDSLVTSLTPSSSHKARLVLEWILEKMVKENVKDHSLFSELILLCGKLKNVPLGMRVFTSMETIGVKPSSLVFNSLMESSERYKPDFHTYNIFISFFSKSGNVDEMLAWYSAEKAVGLGSSLQIFESLILGCVNSRNFEIADQIFEEMMVSEIIPSVSILESMLKGHCKQKSLGRAEEFFRFVIDRFKHVYSRRKGLLSTLEERGYSRRRGSNVK